MQCDMPAVGQACSVTCWQCDSAGISAGRQCDMLAVSDCFT